MHGVGGEVRCPTFMVDVYISITEAVCPPDQKGAVQQAVFGKGFSNTKVSLLEGDNFDFDVLLGMDIILQTNFHMHSNGLFTLCI